MLTETFHSIAMAARTVLKNWRAMLLIAIVYAALLGALYFFIAVREASIAQVVATFCLAIVAPLLFFVLQAMIMGGIASGENAGVGTLLKKSLGNFWKLLLITLPLIAVAVLVAYLLAKAQARLGTSITDTAAELPRRLANAANPRESTRPIDWRAALVSTVRYLTFGLVLPLAAIHLWMAAAGEGLGHAIRKLGSLLSKAFAPSSVFIYIVGFLVFAIAPYFLLFRATPSKHAWLEITLLVARLAVVFALTLFGWVTTVKALAILSAKPPRNQPSNEAA